MFVLKMPFSSKKKVGTAGEVDQEALPISTPRYFFTLYIDPGAPASVNSFLSEVLWAAGAPGSSHRILLTQVTFRAQIDGVTESPTVAQMPPQTRHYVDRRLIFNRFKALFKDHAEFTRIYDVSSWKSHGAELFSRKWFVPGALFSARSYQLKDAVSLSGFLLNSSNSLATHSAVLYHCNYRE